MKAPPTNKYITAGALALASAGLIVCGIFAVMLDQQKKLQTSEGHQHLSEINSLKRDYDAKLEFQLKATKIAEAATISARAAQTTAETSEKKHRAQLVSLGVANDHLLAWMMRDRSHDLPELNKSGDASETLVIELEKFLKITKDNDQFKPVRARIMMQLAELQIHNRKPDQADPLLDSAVTAWSQAGIDEPGHTYRIARARLACLMQALDQQNKPLVKTLLPKARQAALVNPSNDEVENQRLKAVMQVIDGRILESTDPAKALEHFQAAIENMQGIQRTLTEHILVRSDLARYSLEAAALAEGLNQVDNAERLRSEAAKALTQLLKKHPNLQLPKIQLAKIHIIAATADIREGNDSSGSKKLSQAEKLLSTLSASDTCPDGAAMQMAAAMGLRAVLLRDAGQTTAAKDKLTRAVEITEKVVAAQTNNPSAIHEALYRLAVLHWQLAGLIGDSGNRAAEIKQGNKAADLLQNLLKKGDGKHDAAIRRALGYLYGDLGHTASSQGNKKEAANYFDKAASIWQSLIKKPWLTRRIHRRPKMEPIKV